MFDFSVFRALGLLIRTMPFVLLRLGWFMAAGAGVGFLAAGGAWLGHRAAGGEVLSPGAGWGAVAGVAVAALVLGASRKRMMYSLVSGHLAAMVAALDRQPLPFLGGQIATARAIVADRFGDEAALGALDRLVRGVIRTATRLVDDLLRDILPVAVIDRLLRASGVQMALSRGLIEGVVLAHAVRTRSENAWEAAHDGLVLYTQNARPLMANAVWLALTGWGLAGLLALAALPWANVLAAYLPWLPGAAILLALICGWVVKGAVYDPFAQACILQLHQRLTEGQEPLPEWRGRLTQVSDKFRLLGERALGWRTGLAQDA